MRPQSFHSLPCHFMPLLGPGWRPRCCRKPEWRRPSLPSHHLELCAQQFPDRYQQTQTWPLPWGPRWSHSSHSTEMKDACRRGLTATGLLARDCQPVADEQHSPASVDSHYLTAQVRRAYEVFQTSSISTKSKVGRTRWSKRLSPAFKALQDSSVPDSIPSGTQPRPLFTSEGCVAHQTA